MKMIFINYFLIVLKIIKIVKDLMIIFLTIKGLNLITNY